MNLLLISEIGKGPALPAFGPEFEMHMEAKHHPEIYAASCTAWRLLETALRSVGIEKLPLVHFEAMGKPVFADSPLHFSLSHSGKLAAALLSDALCAVDIEIIKDHVQDRLLNRCLNAQEKSMGRDFFECWTKKECLGKLSGEGLPARPAGMDSLNPAYADHFHLHRFIDSSGRQYQLCTLCMNHEKTTIKRIGPEEL